MGEGRVKIQYISSTHSFPITRPITYLDICHSVELLSGCTCVWWPSFWIRAWWKNDDDILYCMKSDNFDTGFLPSDGLVAAKQSCSRCSMYSILHQIRPNAQITASLWFKKHVEEVHRAHRKPSWIMLLYIWTSSKSKGEKRRQSGRISWM